MEDKKLYVFDNNTLTAIFRHYYTDSFPSFWARFDAMIADGSICSVREVHNELKMMSRGDALENWAKNHADFFCSPEPEELQFVSKIFAVPHFQQNIGKRNLLEGKPVADPFIIAKAYVARGTVVTQEQFKPNGAKMPNICEHFKIPCIDLQGFLQMQKWVF
jgi:hypothetical protein